MSWRALLGVFLMGCTGTSLQPLTQDADRDGYPEGEDCDDEDIGIHPGSAEICNGLDDDCDGDVDENADGALPFYDDKDEDGFGDPLTRGLQCAATEGRTAVSGDCNDDDPEANPGSVEVCNGRDDDCNGDIDEGVGATFFEDNDEDGYGDAAAPVASCDGLGLADNDDDCDDDNFEINPEALEVCDGVDNNCDGFADDNDHDDLIGAPTWYRDVDLDGYGVDSGITNKEQCTEPFGWSLKAGDCKDDKKAINPDADEICGDGIDNDCDLAIDDETAVDAKSWYEDVDKDGYGNPGALAKACVVPVGFVANDDDCDDLLSEINPELVWYVDADDDGFGDGAQIVTGCQAPAGAVAEEGDCNDERPDVFPGATEVCNFADDDCDGGIDEGTIGTPWFADGDGDGFGDPDVTVDACKSPNGYVATDDDCDDTDPRRNPETLWYEDTDGDGAGDGASTPVGPACEAPGPDLAPDDVDCDPLDTELAGPVEWFGDDDGDGWGDALDSLGDSCLPPSLDAVESNKDCDDGDELVNPDTAWFQDGDGDGFGNSEVAFEERQCADPGAEWVIPKGDCDDGDAVIHPEMLWYLDADGDGFGTDTAPLEGQGCESPGDDYVVIGGDCADLDVARNPGTLWFVDSDSDGWGDPTRPYNGPAQCADVPDHAPNGDDCDDNADGIGPKAWYRDGDGDGFGLNVDRIFSCADPGAGWSEVGGDCDDQLDFIYPGMTWYPDEDGDGFGDNAGAQTTGACLPPLVGDWSPKGDDCDDDEPRIRPGTLWFDDTDGDGSGDPAIAFGTAQCVTPAGTWAPDALDCDPVDGDVFPGAVDPCNDGLDQDCAGDTDYDCDQDGVVSVGLGGGTDCDDEDDQVTYCGQTADVAVSSCQEVQDIDQSLPDGLYYVDAGGGTFQAWCDLTRDGGGWTLVAANDALVTGGTGVNDEGALSGAHVLAGELTVDLGGLDYWVGLNAWTDLGAELRYEVGADPLDVSRTAFADFSVEGVAPYGLTISNVFTDDPEASPLEGGPFGALSTADGDRDEVGSESCAVTLGRPWWYADSCQSFLWGDTLGPGAAWAGDRYDWGAVWVR